MKPTCQDTFVLVLISTTVAHAANTPWPTSENVGIGTTAPGAELEIGVPAGGLAERIRVRIPNGCVL